MGKKRDQEISGVLSNLGFAADPVVPTGSKIKPPLSKNEYLVFVDYEMPRDVETLEVEFPGGVARMVCSEWKNDTCCRGIDQTPGERVMLIGCPKKGLDDYELTLKMDKLGYRPAIHLEAYAFAKANPKLRLKFPIMARGSKVLSGRIWYVLVLDNVRGKRALSLSGYGNLRDEESRSLFVRKQTSKAA